MNDQQSQGFRGKGQFESKFVAWEAGKIRWEGVSPLSEENRVLNVP